MNSEKAKNLIQNERKHITRKYLTLNLIVILILILISGCKEKTQYTIEEINNIKTIKNTMINNDPNFSLTLNQLSTIQGFDENINPDETSFYALSEIWLDHFKDIYISDKHSFSIKKYDPSGNFIRSFVKQGNGPGEIPDFISNLAVINDTVFVQGYRLTLKFTLDGEYIGNKEIYQESFYLTKLNPVNDTLFFTSETRLVNKGDNYLNDNYLKKDYLTVNANLQASTNVAESYSKNFKSIIEDDVDSGFCTNLATTASGEHLYTAIRNPDVYRINQYNLNAQKTLVIEKKCQTKTYSKTEKEFIEENLGFVTHDDMEKLENLHQFKFQISHLHYDKHADILWVEQMMDYDSATITFDLFKQGIFQGSYDFAVPADVFLPLRDESYFSFLDGKMFFYNSEYNRIEIYSIQY